MKRALTIFALCALLIAGCLSPRRDDSRFFVLSPAGADPATTSARPIVLGVGPIKLPGYLDRQEVVTRVAPNRLELSSTDRWAESLDTDFTRVLAQDLSTDLGTQRFIFYPWYATTHVDYQVKVDVYRFEAGADGKIDLTAHWQVLDGTGKLLIARDSSGAALVSFRKGRDARVRVLHALPEILTLRVAGETPALPKRGTNS